MALDVPPARISVFIDAWRPCDRKHEHSQRYTVVMTSPERDAVQRASSYLATNDLNKLLRHVRDLLS
jgi:hypothetical protein